MGQACPDLDPPTAPKTKPTSFLWAWEDLIVLSGPGQLQEGAPLPVLTIQQAYIQQALLPKSRK